MSKLKMFLVVLVLAVLAGGAAAVWWTGVWSSRFTAAATLYIAPSQPHVLRGAEEKIDWDELEMFRNTQAALMREPFVMMAALRNPKLKNLPSIVREDMKRNTVPWLISQIHVNMPKNKSGMMTVTTTQPDPNDAVTIVNAVVQAYIENVVNRDQGIRRDRLDSLTAVSAQKEEEVRKLREDLRREMESMGAGDEESVAMRGRMAENIYAEYLRELQTMRRERATLQGRLLEATEALKKLDDTQISDLEVSGLAFSIPVYRDLHTRMTMSELEKPHAGATRSETKSAPAENEGNRAGATLHENADPGKAPSAGEAKMQPDADASRETHRWRDETNRELSEEERIAAGKILDELKNQCRGMLRQARRVEMEREISALQVKITISTDQVDTFAKEVASKARDAEQIGRSTVAAQMLRAKLENLERILREVSDERERLKVELDNPRLRVMIVGDRDSPATITGDAE
jgi:hypothetical protein